MVKRKQVQPVAKPQSITEQVNINNLVFVPYTRTKGDRFVVRYSPSTGSLLFNPQMVEMLKIGDWEQVVVGKDQTNGIIVLKKVEPEEYGCVAIRMPNKQEYEKNPDRARNSRIVRISHALNGLSKQRAEYIAERSGIMVCLKKVTMPDME